MYIVICLLDQDLSQRLVEQITSTQPQRSSLVSKADQANCQGMGSPLASDSTLFSSRGWVQ